ncbi:acyltransferase [Calidifontibacter sp. DB0510]|uniref:Acyltransferase n=1 Tax=Metallococcus carri TaxID=1656884 RepID=A0A967EGD8_9MICO|nr:acyltransferase [Metallococcus carri]NHN54948.1 acyltransferase [Metallococcus carri]NOP37294.1 acyltransferase [Calidifontibacter sp. DB2511S]
MRRFPWIDGLRGLAALLVLLSHVAFWTGASAIDVSGGLLARGDSGVAVFFAISAFLLLRPWLTGPVDLHRYAVHRAARILPAYAVALVTVLAVAATGATPEGGLGGVGRVLSNLLLVQGYTGQTYQAFTQTWSITTEVTFYLLLPVLGPALRRLCDRAPRAVLPTLAAVALLGLVVQAGAAAWSRQDPAGHAGALATSALGHAAWFAVGAALAVLQARPDVALRPARWTPGVVVGVAAIVYLVASTPLAGPADLRLPTVPQAVTKELLYAVFAGLLVFAASASPRTRGERELASWPGLGFAGDLSYAVFLWHVLVLQVLYLFTGRQLFTGGFGWMLFAVVTVTVVIAQASAQLLELPVLRRARRSDPAARTPVRTG